MCISIISRFISMFIIIIIIIIITVSSNNSNHNNNNNVGGGPQLPLAAQRVARALLVARLRGSLYCAVLYCVM